MQGSYESQNCITYIQYGLNIYLGFINLITVFILFIKQTVLSLQINVFKKIFFYYYKLKLHTAYYIGKFLCIIIVGKLLPTESRSKIELTTKYNSYLQ